MFIVNLEDGTTIGSKKGFYWDNLPKDKRITSVQLTHPQWLKQQPKLFLCLNQKHLFYFLREAVASLGGQPTVIAEILGGVDTELNVVVEIRLEMSGTVKISTYPYIEEIFKINRGSLRDGIKKTSN